MTCIVGIIRDGVVTIGGDSCASDGYNNQIRRDPKVFRLGKFVIGYTTSFRMGQLLRFKLQVPGIHSDVDLYQYMCTDFVDAVRSCLKANGFASKKDEVEIGGTFLVGVRGRLFMIDSDYQVGECQGLYAAVGCGEDYALGALYALELQNPYLAPEEAVRVALNAASAYSPFVEGPYVVESTAKA